MSNAVTPVPFDAELQHLLDTVGTGPLEPPVNLEILHAVRASLAAATVPTSEAVGDAPIVCEDRTVPGPAGAPDVVVTIMRPRDLRPGAPGFLSIHGGGLVLGNRHMDTARSVAMIEALGCVIVNVEYRLAPENPGPAQVEDCYAALEWMAKNATDLGFDPAKLLVIGQSAGGCLTAGVTLLARDRSGPAIAGQILLVPMLDDRNESVSSLQYDGIGTWTRAANLFAWEAALGAAFQSPEASQYIAPARATDLSGLPPTFIEVGSAELFRDEAIEYASRIWAVGGQAELHVWSGGFHAYEMFFPQAALTQDALAARLSWIRRTLAP